MTDKIMNTNALPSFLITMFKTDRIKVREMDNGLLIEPTGEVVDDDLNLQQEREKYKCPLLGTARGGSFTVDKFLEMKRQEKELEIENEKRLFS
jgi:hypothetical protein